MKDSIPRAAVIGVGSGLLLMAFFTLIWMGIAESGLKGVWATVITVIFLVFSLAFALNGAYLLVIAKRYLKLSTQENNREGKSIGKRFGIIFGTEGVVIGIAARILSATNHYNFFFPVLALIVGLHFYPMAKVFKRNIDYYIATWSCIVAIVGFILVFNAVLSDAVAIVIGVGLALSTSFYGFYMMFMGRKILRANSEYAKAI